MLKAIICAFVLFCSAAAYASHLRGGQIVIVPIDCATHTYGITLTLYTNTLSAVLPQGVLSFGDGKSVILSGVDNIRIDSANAIGEVVFAFHHEYPQAGNYLVSYYEQNRNAAVLNFDDKGETPFYIESSFTSDPSFCGQFLLFTIPPTDRGCSGLAFSHNPGVVTAADDSVSYQLIVPLEGHDDLVPGYLYPNAQKFYTANYQMANENGDGPPTFSINQDGTLLWDAPGAVGEYDMAMKVFLWAKVGEAWVNISWVIRDMQVIVEDCGVSRPYLEPIANLCVNAGTSIERAIRGYSKVFSPVKIEVTTLDNFLSSPPNFYNVGVLQSTAAPNDTANLKIKWDLTCDLVRPKPYRFVFKISSYTQTGIRISSYQTWDVTVTGPPPQYQSMTLDLATKKLNIQWKNYLCANAQTFQVWRRVDRGPSSSDQCLTGIPKSWGFTKIGETTGTNFTDKNLSPGATYCYRLLAIYTTPYQTFSIASKDTCIGPIVADAPVVTNVSVATTDKSSGSILVRWTSPFQINKALFPSPYVYDVFRTIDGNNYRRIISKTSDTTFVDTNLDVVDTLYGYKTVVYSPQSVAHDNPIDTSALAFFPRLTYEPTADSIKLSWDAQVPWSNQSGRFPWHFIYRKELGASRYVLIDSVDVTVRGDFIYKNYSTQKSFPLEDNTVYQYKIETQGVYGNPHIKEPLQNFSNEVTAQSNDKKLPCSPTLEVSSTACETLLNSPCTTSALSNQLNWKYPTDCGNDVVSYQVIFSERPNSDSTIIASTTDLVYIDLKKISRAGCYRIIATDRSGNVGAPSKAVCVENCSYIYLPNVITVNNDGLNETFPGLSDANENREPAKCPRFVKEFNLQIYDRLGQQVYVAENVDSTHPNLEWKGLDRNGKELPAGLYYYSAKIFFYATQPELQSQNVKGWVSLVR